MWNQNYDQIITALKVRARPPQFAIADMDKDMLKNQTLVFLCFRNIIPCCTWIVQSIHRCVLPSNIQRQNIQDRLICHLGRGRIPIHRHGFRPNLSVQTS